MDIETVEPSFRNYLESRPIPPSPAIESEVLMNRIRLGENASDEDRELMFTRLIEATDEVTTTSKSMTLIYNNEYILLHRNNEDYAL